MQNLGNRPVLAHVLARCSEVKAADVIVCAVPDEPDSEALEIVARNNGAVTFRGSERDVLARYTGAAKSVGADIVMRVTSDCPLIDPDICEAVLALRANENVDYAANNMPPSFPHGLDCEAMSFAALVEADAKATEPYDREHVTPWLRRADHLTRSNLHSGDEILAAHRWTLDFPEDMSFFRAVYDAVPDDNPRRMADILALLTRQPFLSDINSMRRSKPAIKIGAPS